jgi:hemerythrin-like domain-containing protein
MPLHLMLTLADDMHRVHAALRHDLDCLPEALSSPKEAHRYLSELRAHVAQHFQCEEEGGYMAAVLQRKPQSERAVQRLLGEHRPLVEVLDVLVREVEGAEQIDNGFRSRVAEWAELLRRHETEENVLVEDAFNRDFGTED